MIHLSDSELLARLAGTYDNARNAPREGDGGRGHGMQGAIADEWMRVRLAAIDRGLVQ